ncbi:MAG: TIGR02757 family protein [Muribaculaceae bacterium]|nr:TIGR02757 family protein [Muribaculaceae bacterium]MDE6755117.1 TIGR02757 family protein [Muribaculaceae bacterium]
MKSEIITTIPPDIRDLLNEEAERINNVSFIDKDPVQFPRRFSRLQDIEIAAFLSAIIAWGNRKMICRDAERMLNLMDNEPYRYVMEEGYEDLNPDMNLHRTFFGRHFQYFLRGLHKIYSDYGSVDAFSASVKAGDSETPSWKLVAEMQKIMSEVNGGATCSQCLPVNLEQTALKRINMALRWLVRDDGIVDMGVWKSIPKSKLYIPLDVHVGNISRELGLLTRKANDKKSTEQLTELLRTIRPEDPVVYDFALFGIGVESRDVKGKVGMDGADC